MSQGSNQGLLTCSLPSGTPGTGLTIVSPKLGFPKHFPTSNWPVIPPTFRSHIPPNSLEISFFNLICTVVTHTMVMVFRKGIINEFRMHPLLCKTDTEGWLETSMYKRVQYSSKIITKRKKCISEQYYKTSTFLHSHTDELSYKASVEWPSEFTSFPSPNKKVK